VAVFRPGPEQAAVGEVASGLTLAGDHVAPGASTWRSSTTAPPGPRTRWPRPLPTVRKRPGPRRGCGGCRNLRRRKRSRSTRTGPNTAGKAVAAPAEGHGRACHGWCRQSVPPAEDRGRPGSAFGWILLTIRTSVLDALVRPDVRVPGLRCIRQPSARPLAESWTADNPVPRERPRPAVPWSACSGIAAGQPRVVTRRPPGANAGQAATSRFG